MEAGVVPIDREGNWPNLMLQSQCGPVMSVRALVSFFARYPVLELFLGLAQVVQKARRLCMIFRLEASSEILRPARHAQEMFNERLIRVSEDLGGAHGSVSLHRLIAVGRTQFSEKPG